MMMMIISINISMSLILPAKQTGCIVRHCVFVTYFIFLNFYFKIVFVCASAAGNRDNDWHHHYQRVDHLGRTCRCRAELLKGTLLLFFENMELIYYFLMGEWFVSEH